MRLLSWRTPHRRGVHTRLHPLGALYSQSRARREMEMLWWPRVQLNTLSSFTVESWENRHWIVPTASGTGSKSQGESFLNQQRDEHEGTNYGDHAT